MNPEEDTFDLDLSYPYDETAQNTESPQNKLDALIDQVQHLQVFCDAIQPMLNQKYLETENKKQVLHRILDKFCIKDPSGFILAGKFKNLVDCSTNGAIRHPKVSGLMKDIGIKFVIREGGFRFYPGYSYRTFVKDIPTKIDEMRAYFASHRELFLSSDPPKDTKPKTKNITLPKMITDFDVMYSPSMQSPPPVMNLPKLK